MNVSGCPAKAYDYTFISYLGTNLDNESGAAMEADQYVRQLPQKLKDGGVAVVAMGLMGECSAEKPFYSVRRLEFDQRGMRDTTESLLGTRNQKIANGDSQRVPAQGEAVEPSHRETLKNFFVDAMRRFPARHYVFHLASHGDGIHGLRPDGNPGPEGRRGRCGSIPLKELQGMLSEVRQETGETASILDLDACLQGHREVVSALKHEAGFLIASSTEICGESPNEGAMSGHPQFEMIEAAVANPKVDPEQLVRDFVERAAKLGRREEPREDINPTLSAFDTQRMSALEAGLDRLGRDLVNQWKAAPDRQAWMRSLLERLEGVSTIPNAKGYPYLDLMDVVSRLGSKEQVAEIGQACQSTTVAHFAGETLYGDHRYDFSRYSPLATFLPIHSNKVEFDLQRSAMAALEPCFWAQRQEYVSYNSDLLRLQYDCRRGLARGLAGESIRPLLRDLEQFHRLSDACMAGQIKVWEDDKELKALPQEEQQARQKGCLAAMRSYLTLDFMEAAGMKQIWKDKTPEFQDSWKAFREAPNQPQGWNEFVELIWDYQADQAWKASRLEMEQRLSNTRG